MHDRGMNFIGQANGPARDDGTAAEEDVRTANAANGTQRGSKVKRAAAARMDDSDEEVSAGLLSKLHMHHM